ncbi:MAG: hypothetical protein AAFR87_15815 [Bacteroidota bacterium]
MRARTIVYASLFVLGLFFWFYGEKGNWYHDEFGFWGNVLFYLLMWRLFRGIRLRVFKLDKHVWVLDFRKSSEEVHFVYHKRAFQHQEDSFRFAETTCVIHKSDISRLSFQTPGLRYAYKTEGSAMLIVKYLVLIFSISLGTLFDLFLREGPVGKTLAQYLYGPTETALDLRPTAVSFVKGKNKKSLILLPTYGWKQETLEEIVEVCKDYKIKVFDKRPHREKQENAFI